MASAGAPTKNKNPPAPSIHGQPSSIPSFAAGLLAGLLIAILVILFFPSFFPSVSGPALFALPPACTAVTPLFSPGASDELISLIRSAQSTIDVEMYVFTDENLARELADAARRGVVVRVILEPRVESRNLDSIATALLEGGVQVRWASVRFQLTHSKLMIIDQKAVLVGSINFSKAAQSKNREAAAVLSGAAVQQYVDVFETDWPLASLARGAADG